MNDIIFYLALSGLLTVLMWTPYIVARMVTWGIPTFLNNYPEGFPAKTPEQPLWAARAQRAHLNMVETMPAFVAVIAASLFFPGLGEVGIASVTCWAAVFFYARLAYAAVYITGLPYLRTPVYLLSWLSILMIGAEVLSSL